MRTLLFAVALSGCATTTLSNFSESMNSLVGQNVEVAFSRFGYPERQNTINGRNVYYWGSDQPTGPSCQFQIVANQDGRIESWSGYGNADGCGTLVPRR